MKHSTESVKEKIKGMNLVDTLFIGKEIKALPDILTQKEEIVAVTKGFYKNGVGLLCATTKRILFINKGLIKLNVEEFPLKYVSSISTESGLMMTKVRIFTSGNNAQIERAQKDDAKRFVEATRRLIEERDEYKKSETEEINNNEGIDVYGQIEKLAALKEKGIITDEEFNAKKTKLLGL